ETGPNLVREASRRVAIRQTPGVPEDLEHGKVGDACAVREAMALEIDDALAMQALPELIEQPGFSNARLSDDADDLAMSHACRFETAAQQRELLAPSDECRRVSFG